MRWRSKYLIAEWILFITGINEYNTIYNKSIKPPIIANISSEVGLYKI